MEFNLFLYLIAGLFSRPLVPAEVAASTSGVDEFESVVSVILVASGQHDALTTLLRTTLKT